MTDIKDIKDIKGIDLWGKKEDHSYWDEIFKGINFQEILDSTETLTWLQLQYLGGFDLPEFLNYTLINADSIFKRLYYFLNFNRKNKKHNNIIALCELKKNPEIIDEQIKKQLQKYNVTKDEQVKEGIIKEIKRIELDNDKSVRSLFTSLSYKLQGEIPKIYGCNSDTGFITSLENSTKADFFADNDLFSFKDLKILSIHFDSSGPNGPHQLEYGKDYYTLLISTDPTKKISLSIRQFIEYQFSLKNKIKDDTDKKLVNVICGDSNITVAKSKVFDPTITRDMLGREIAIGLNNFFITPKQEWLVLMSSNPIIKNRRGFVLKNQQLGKSLPDTRIEEIGEADGTILAIKIFTDKKKEIIDYWKRYFLNDNRKDSSKEFVIYCQENSYPVDDKTNTYFLKLPKEIFNKLDEKEKEEHFKKHHAFNFKVSSTQAMTTKNRPREQIFLDHSVLYTELDILNIFIKGNICFTYAEYFEKKQIPINTIGPQLIVLNLNSMINTKQSWNLNVRNHLSDINKLDEALFNIMKSKILKKNNGTFTPIDSNLPYKMFDGEDKSLYFNVKPDDFNELNIKVKEAFTIIKKEIEANKAIIEESVRKENERIEKEQLLIEEEDKVQQLQDLNLKKEELLIENEAQLQDLIKELQDEEAISATKYLKKGYYEKYIKYKTKYMNLKNTIK